MKIIAIIPARYASTRFVGKPLIDIAGKSMIRRVYEQAKKCHLLSAVVVATDDERIFEHCQQHKIAVIMTHQNHENGTDRCAEAYRKLGKNYDIVVNIQGDEPLINPQQISEIIGIFSKNKDAKIATLVRKIEDNSLVENANIVKTVFANTGKALYFSRSPIPFCRNKNTKITYFQHIGMYAFKPTILQKIVKLPIADLENIEKLEQLRWLSNGFDIFVATSEYPTHAIDTPQDVAKVLALIK